MKKTAASLLVFVTMVLGALVFAPSAQAYPAPPPPEVSPPTVQSGPPAQTQVSTPKTSTSPPQSSSVLPGTGGPAGIVLIGAVALLLVGGVTLVVSRRHAND